jgi:hypothetical protein
LTIGFLIAGLIVYKKFKRRRINVFDTRLRERLLINDSTSMVVGIKEASLALERLY